ncbi:MAG: carboxypeptidase-like regulatory domain-containing protein [candidate division Zixibacteria bacterium]|nr:carboxypeptidase-like regulatory domain-containing protein [candidate division Zixibacteria bacterium]MDH3938673.1 carboxypeptidase-like regulatory domain-containing protein [candidate division Zixibacteria bacterium]MDH4033238.1 carboxypeptidase-like regulatory domain-containing protein [candidate division Zixibacteria bacterium]
MRRNMKFLLLLAIFATSIMAAYFISGCGDDSTVIEFPDPVTNDTTVIVEEEDRVLGSIQGVVANAYNNALLVGVEVTWTKNDADFSYTTNADGYYLIDDSLSSGYYVLTFSMNGYAQFTATVYIPTIAEIKEDIDDDAVGWTEYMATANIWMLPMTATVTGKVYTALPAPPAKDGEPVLALDDPNLVSVAAGVEVILDYGFDIHPDKYNATTDAFGTYTFVDVPLVFNTDEPWWEDAPKDGGPNKALADAWEVDLVILPFTVGSESFEAVTLEDISMLPGTTTIPNVYAPLNGSGDDADVTDNPVVLAFNFDTPGFMVTDDLVINFSKEMNPTTVEIDLDGPDFAFGWDAGFMTLTVNPALSLVPDETYDVEISGMSADGLPLWDSEDHNNLWDRDLMTQQGIRFVATNLDDYGDDSNPFTLFPLDADITITFDMDVVLPTPGDELTGWVVLYDTWNDREVNATVSASGATITINPSNDLKSFSEYLLDFKVFSALRGDFATDAEVKSPELTYTTVNMASIPAAPTNFVLDMDTDWKADFNTTWIGFQWDSVGGAEYYEIFAKDNMQNTDLIVVNPYIEDISFHTMQVGSVNLADAANASFDLYFDDAIQTPFSAGTEITFQVRAVNSAGAGPFSSEITVGDETPPNFDAYIEGCADNTAGTEPMEFYIYTEGDFDEGDDHEYLSTIAFAFLEMGGDPDFVLTSADVAWDWDVDMRNGEGMGTVAIGMCGSADYMVVTLTDNSGNASEDTVDIHPYLVIEEPNAATTEFEAPSFTIEWDIWDSDCGSFNDYLDLYFSYDGGVTWTDTVFEWDWWSEYEGSWSVLDTVYSTTAMVGLANTNGGWIWQSDVFTHTGIDVTGPDSAWLDTSLFYDDGGVDSTGVPLTWDYAGLDSVTIQYRYEDEGWSAWMDDTTIAVTGGTGSYTFYAPDMGWDYMCQVRVADWDGDNRPNDQAAWEFYVTNDYTDLTDPSTGEAVAGGADYVISWDTTVYAPHLTSGEVIIEYSIDRGATWMTIVDPTANDGEYTWAVPATTYANDSAQVRIRDKWNLNTLDATGNFDISGIVIDAPTAGTEWLVGTGQDIEWHSVGNVGNISLYWSNDGFVTDSTVIDLNYAGGSPLNWTVPANSASSNITIRLWGNSDAVYTTSGVMTFSGAVVTAPVSGNHAQGSSTTVTWTTVGTLIGGFVDIQYKYDTSGFQPNWITLASNVPDTGSWLWNPVPAPPADEAWVRVKKAGAPTGVGQGDAFSIAGVIVRVPNGPGDVWTRGNSYDITWDVITATVGLLRIELSTNAGVDWTTLATDIDPAAASWTWDIDPAETVSAACMIRISEMAGSISDASNAFFEIQ